MFFYELTLFNSFASILPCLKFIFLPSDDEDNGNFVTSDFYIFLLYDALQGYVNSLFLEVRVGAKRQRHPCMA